MEKFAPVAALLLLLLCFPVAFSGHDYGQALSKSLLFFEAQRSGVLPRNQRVTWRSHSGLTDGKSSGVCLSLSVSLFLDFVSDIVALFFT